MPRPYGCSLDRARRGPSAVVSSALATSCAPDAVTFNGLTSDDSLGSILSEDPVEMEPTRRDAAQPRPDMRGTAALPIERTCPIWPVPGRGMDTLPLKIGTCTQMIPRLRTTTLKFMSSPTRIPRSRR